jgi:hypothetical protein
MSMEAPSPDEEGTVDEDLDVEAPRSSAPYQP